MLYRLPKGRFTKQEDTGDHKVVIVLLDLQLYKNRTYAEDIFKKVAILK